MARNLETIITELKEVYPTIKINDEILSTEEYNSTINSWAEDIRNQELDEEANGYKKLRQEAYPSYGEQLDYIFHHGLDAWKSDIIQPIKDQFPKP